LPPFTDMWWSGSRDISLSGSKLRDMNGTCIIILDKKYNIANSSCHFGPYDPQCHELFAIYWNIKRSYTLLSTIYCIGDFKIVSISVFVLANFFIFLFLVFYLSVFLYLFLPHFSKISSYAATVFICMYLCLTWYFWYVLYTIWLFYIVYRAIFPLRLVRSILHITFAILPLMNDFCWNMFITNMIV
jgi:hypothetical protein